MELRIVACRLILTALLVLCAHQALARCTGRDLRPMLTPAAEARMETELARTPYAHGNHWIARKAGRQLHVIGTMHTGDRRLGPVMRRLRPVVLSADAVLLEVTSHETDAEMDRIMRDRSVFLLDRPPYLPDMLSPPVWDYLSARMARDGFLPDEVARMQPWFAGFFLDQSPCSETGGRIRGLDDRIEALAQRARIPIDSLEPSAAGLQALAAQPLRDQARILEYDLTSEMNFDDQVVTMSEAYFDERLAEGLLIQDWTMYADLDVPRAEVRRLLDGFQERLIDARNRAWLPVIERTGGAVLVVAVGGAHLPGEAGLLNLLAGQGWVLERAGF